MVLNFEQDTVITSGQGRSMCGWRSETAVDSVTTMPTQDGTVLQELSSKKYLQHLINSHLHPHKETYPPQGPNGFGNAVGKFLCMCREEGGGWVEEWNVLLGVGVEVMRENLIQIHFF